MLIVTLKIWEEDGLVSRKVYAEVPPKVEYSLTDRALSLLPCINTLIAWVKENMEDIILYIKFLSVHFPKIVDLRIMLFLRLMHPALQFF